MKKFCLFILFISLLVVGVQGYVVTIDCPAEVQAGAPLVVTGDTTFPVGTQMDVVFYKVQSTTPAELDRKIVVVDESKAFIVSFNTNGLLAGQYKVEVQFPANPGTTVSSGSTTVKILTIVDRSGEIHLDVPKDQVMDEALLIEGYIPDIGVSTINIKITGPKGFVVPPLDIRTTTLPGKTDGIFSKKVTVTDPGNYYVSFSDPKGYIGTIKFSVYEPETTSVTTLPETTIPVTETPSPKAPLSGLVLVTGLLAAGALAVMRRK